MSKINIPKKGAVNLDKEFYKKTFSDEVRKGFTGEHNMNVAEGSYRMIKGSAPKNIDGSPMYGTIGQMTDKAAYKYGMHGDRNEMGKKAMNQKMGEYFPKQSRYLTQDGRAIDASRTQAAEMEEADMRKTSGDESKKYYTTKTASTTLDNDKTFTLSKSKSYTINEFGEKEYSGSSGGAGNVMDFTASKEPSSSNIGEIVPGTFTRSKQRVPATTTYINPKGKERTAKSGTLKAKALETIYNIRTKQGKFRSTEKYSPEEKVYKFKGGTETITRT